MEPGMRLADQIRTSRVDEIVPPAAGMSTSHWILPDGEGLMATVHEVGTGVPFVFLHGLVGLNEHWEGVVDRVSGKVRCVLFELPLLQLRGEHCSIHGATDLTARFLRQYFNEPVVLVGNSFGGHVAARLAIYCPELVRGVVLAGASGLIEKSMVADVQIRPSREWLRRKIGELFFDQTAMKEADLDRAYAELSDRGGARAMVKLSRSARRDHLGDAMAQIRQPTLLIWGRQDIVTPPEAAEGFQKYIPHAKMVWLERCGHAPMIEKPEEFAAAVRDFLPMLEAAPGLAPPASSTPKRASA
jgi:pimeloyl-ACP methyl ester carboxylesterase